MKYFSRILILFLSLPTIMIAQNALYIEPAKKQADSLLLIFPSVKNDSVLMDVCNQLGYYYEEFYQDSAKYFFEQQLKLAKQLNQKLWEAHAYSNLGYSMFNIGSYSQALQYYLNALDITENTQSEEYIWKISSFSRNEDPRLARLYVLSNVYDLLGILYKHIEMNQISKAYFYKSLAIAEKVNDHVILQMVSLDLGSLYLSFGKLDSALIFERNALLYSNISGYSKYRGLIYRLTAEIYTKLENQDSAKLYYNLAIHESKKNENNQMTLAEIYLSLAKNYNAKLNSDSSRMYAEKSLKILNQLQTKRHLPEIYSILASTYKNKGNSDSAFIYLELAINAKDSLTNAVNLKQIQNIGFEQERHKEDLEKEKIIYKSKIRTNALMGGLLTLVIIAFLLFRNNKQKQKAKQKIELAYDHLKSTQAQLIQSEKMASLGELTAGIAHEIQNPLNFVNNFSEINNELIDELNDELNKGDIEEAKAISKDIKENGQKINHHGKRAEAIVKGMLLHSRASSGEKVLTDINTLCDEYLRLAFHGFKAKDKSFSADFKLDLDKNLPKIEVVPQDIGRVLLNLINNAFYVVNEKAKQNIESYKAEVVVSTSLKPPFGGLGGHIEVWITDNGPGIPTSIKDKIFQPFFTTKPTGSGTGLGLSLSYDIVKAHGGKLKMETKEGAGSEFIIDIPINS